MRIGALLALSAFVLGCNNGSDNEELVGADDTGVAESELTGNVSVGATLRTTAALNLRAGAGTQFKILLTIPQGSIVSVRQNTPSNGFYAVKYADTNGWASGQYLTAAAGPGNAPSVKIGGPAVRAHVQRFANEACAFVGGCKYDLGTYNGHQPTADRAIDMMQGPAGRIPDTAGNDRGTRISDFGINNGNTHKVDYVIWRQRINSRDGRGWRWMADRGSITQNHYDHVHVSFDP